jgi:DNA polymerase-3 subunit delta
MGSRKSHEVDAWLSQPQPSTRIALFYGPDHGLVAERAAKCAQLTGLPLGDPFSVLKLDAGVFESDPGRLLDEAHAIAMFAPQRLIWIRGAGADKRFAEDVKALVARPAADAIVLIEAGDLKKGAALRSIVEAAAQGMALPCYADAGRDLDRLIDDELGGTGLSIGADARRLLRDSLGGDRLASRGELQKLALYMHGRRDVTVDDVAAAISDVSDVGIGEVMDALLTGNRASLDSALSRALSTPNAAGSLLSAALRQFQAFHLMGGAVAQGAKPAAVVAGSRPPLPFARHPALQRGLETWSVDRIGRSLRRLQALVLATRRRPELATAMIRQAFLGLTMEARPRRPS